ncbi:Predicted DNA-binding transcriptional regulator YafY, contains an HTH and WYL domains [Arenibacter nanhaiticus]|uniref:Predicted DNA-binding transcriptional regulator YafY, contains an HTH and WYL domains n=1 Tax=Arenibacter nanhaiticus TaxID=558155 RepID=A0A1M6L7L6_9FLAO|nr:WYL domain-containing protein [Arenibacter nanhaiticus]SHJ67009.1 Predicted DNA-binding transcriptional regulator YafY, contains an HTH and WYL domains [Arenibacter nanhaiticus]
MAKNKHQHIRYNTLDKCFSNFFIAYSFEDLLHEVNKAIAEFDPTSGGINQRQLRKDIAWFKHADGYNAPLKAYRGPNGYYYRYEDKGFSINKSPLSETEMVQLNNALSILKRFEGSPEFEWINETTTILNDKLGLQDPDQKVLVLEANVDYTGYEHMAPIFNAIIHKKVLRISYSPFDEQKPINTFNFHPYLLKQYNNRWFAFGKNEAADHMQWNVPLDRIAALEIQKEVPYSKDTTDWKAFFKDFVGVTKEEGPVEKIKLRFKQHRLQYFTTKPIHTEWDEVTEDGTTYITLDVLINKELIQQLLSYGQDVAVIEPASLKQQMKKHAEAMADYYKN